jgi:hypothetical protein
MSDIYKPESNVSNHGAKEVRISMNSEIRQLSERDKIGIQGISATNFMNLRTPRAFKVNLHHIAGSNN